MKLVLRTIFVTIIIFAILWVGISSFLYQMLNPEKTPTQAFYHIPKSFLMIMKD